MKINWFPGHMTKALRMMEEETAKVDCIIYVLDARAPFSCVNPSFCDIVGSKPILYILNKSDMVESACIKEWQAFFSTKNGTAIVMNSTQSGASKIIEKAINTLKTKRTEYFKQKGLRVAVRAMVLGVPNSGKSTLVNNLCGEKRAVTGNKPGVTKGKQWVTIASGLEVLDTPGTLWPSLDDPRVALNLAYIGSIKDDVLDKNDLALSLIADLNTINPSILVERYKIEQNLSAIEALEAIAQNKRLLIKGGDYDYDRACTMVLDDFRKGRLGKICLEKPRK